MALDCRQSFLVSDISFLFPFLLKFCKLFFLKEFVRRRCKSKALARPQTALPYDEFLSVHDVHSARETLGIARNLHTIYGVDLL